jgi:hypothetical protein
MDSSQHYVWPFVVDTVAALFYDSCPPSSTAETLTFPKTCRSLLLGGEENVTIAS